MCELKIFVISRSIECYKDTEMKAKDITERTDELKSSDNVRYTEIKYTSL